MKRIIILLVFMVIPHISFSLNMGDYLILDNIGDYKRITKGGPSGSILAAVFHFGRDHIDESYGIAYINDKTEVWIDVQVTQHAGAESDKWLLHEVEDSYRSGQLETLGIFTEGVVMRKIDSNRVYWIGLGGGDFMWLSENKVVKISYVDLQGTKPEPIEIVKAYLAKHPSTITLTDADMKSRAHNEKWIKDEMERRLWLCDKWFMQLQLEKAELKDVLKESVKHMEEFLNYREKYYGVSGEEEKGLLNTYLDQQNGTEIKNRLESLKQWWTENKAGTINLP